MSTNHNRNYHNILIIKNYTIPKLKNLYSLIKRGLTYTLHIYLKYFIIYAIQININLAAENFKFLVPVMSVNYTTLLAILTYTKGS